jgi:hypothetical protein
MLTGDIKMAFKIIKIIYPNTTFGLSEKKIVTLAKIYKDRRKALQDCYLLNQHAILNPHTVRYEVFEV